MLDGWKAFQHTEVVEEISGMASGEAALEVMIKRVEEQWKSLEFNLQLHRDSKDVFILGNTDDIQVSILLVSVFIEWSWLYLDCAIDFYLFSFETFEIFLH